jgi:DNA-binding transcriptional regulator YiaG
MSEQALEKMIRDAAGTNGGLSSPQFARLKGVGIEVVNRWKNGQEPMPSGWAFFEKKWIPQVQ